MVVEETFADAALIILGHGSKKNSDSAGTVRQHAAALRQRQTFATVREAFWKQEPRVADVLAGIGASRVFIVPFFISEGYFSERIIPESLGFRAASGEAGRLLRRSGQLLVYCRPVGTHSRMAGVLLARAQEVVRQFPFPRAPDPGETSLFIAGHGTEKDEASREAIERQVQDIAATRTYAAVHALFMEEEPRIPRCYELARTSNLVVVPFFASDGLHVQEDIPILLGQPEALVRQQLVQGRPTWSNPTGKHGKLVWYARSVGTEPSLAEVILERVREGAGFSG